MDRIPLLTLILPKLKVISLCNQYRSRPASSVQSDHAYTVSCPTSSFHLDIPKKDGWTTLEMESGLLHLKKNQQVKG